MLKIIIYLIFFLPTLVCSQIGLKAGINFANITKSSSLNNSNRSGYHAGLILATPSKRLLGSQTELLYSRQGYNFRSNTNTGNVDLDYIMLPQYMSINITKYFSILFGGQIAYLINAKVDSTGIPSTNTPLDGILKYYQKFDFGYGGGAEIHPIGGLLIGARVNISIGNLFNDLTDPAKITPESFIPKVNVKNNLFQIYLGWKFIGKNL